MPAFSTAGLIRSGIAVGMLCGLAAPVLGSDDNLQSSGAMQPASGPSEALFNFDIPAQALASALNRYVDIVGQSTLFASDMVANRTSSALRGRYPAEAALQLLLEGTGLIAEKVRADQGSTFLLKQADRMAPVRAGLANLFNREDYAGQVQARIWQALCADARTAPGRYQSLFQFQVDASGRVNSARLLGSTGDARRDAALIETLQHVQLDALPPPGVAQLPLTMMLKPSASTSASNNGAGPSCGNDRGAHAP